MGNDLADLNHLPAISARCLWYFLSPSRRLGYRAGPSLDRVSGARTGKVDGTAWLVREDDMKALEQSRFLLLLLLLTFIQVC